MVSRVQDFDLLWQCQGAQVEASGKCSLSCFTQCYFGGFYCISYRAQSHCLQLHSLTMLEVSQIELRAKCVPSCWSAWRHKCTYNYLTFSFTASHSRVLQKFILSVFCQGWTKTNAFHVCITSYKLVIQDHAAFKRKKWKYLILDEVSIVFARFYFLDVLVKPLPHGRERSLAICVRANLSIVHMPHQRRSQNSQCCDSQQGTSICFTSACI